MAKHMNATDNLVVHDVAAAAAMSYEPASAPTVPGDMVLRNPAPNASPTSAPSGAYREYRMVHPG